MFNYREPGRNLVLEGENSLGQSWYDGETTMFLEYPDNWWWMFWTRVATLGQLWDYTIYHDEIRESPTPGLFIGLTYLYPCACPHRLANAHRGGCTQFVWLTVRAAAVPQSTPSTSRPSASLGFASRSCRRRKACGSTPCLRATREPHVPGV